MYRRDRVPLDPFLVSPGKHESGGQSYLTALLAERGERVRAEPFDAIELSVGVLFGDDAEE
ncbi:hypothetical protein [Sorangium sp. So ce388]|uniref:hypothetical protein n=1 Tax=Sorangium sp. So ce388 TaxID=3133309 RepID=UPI003F5C7373